jgi:hypothetical protein
MQKVPQGQVHMWEACAPLSMQRCLPAGKQAKLNPLSRALEAMSGRDCISLQVYIIKRFIYDQQDLDSEERHLM